MTVAGVIEECMRYILPIGVAANSKVTGASAKKKSGEAENRALALVVVRLWFVTTTIIVGPSGHGEGVRFRRKQHTDRSCGLSAYVQIALDTEYLP